MFVRQDSFEVVPGKLDALRETYNRDCVPIVRAAPGNVDVYLLEPAEGTGPIVAVTIWQSEEHARAYDASGTAQEVVPKVSPSSPGRPRSGRTYGLRIRPRLRGIDTARHCSETGRRRRRMTGGWVSMIL